MAHRLLDQRVARRHGAGDRQMADDVAHQARHAQPPGAQAVDGGDGPHQPRVLDQHVGDVDERSRRDGGDDADALGRAQHQRARFPVERLQQRDLGVGDAVVGVHDGLARRRHRRPAARGRGARPERGGEVGRDRAGRRRVARGDGGGGALAQGVAAAEPQQRHHLAHDQHDDCQHEPGRERQP